MKTLTILGGTFDPFHIGHLYLATQAVADFGGAVRVIPNGSPPHRTPVLPWEARRRMCQLATADWDGIEVGDDEPPGEPRYTVDTLSAIKRRAPETTLLLIVGEDAYEGFLGWHQPEGILQLAHLLVVPRGAAAPPPALPFGKVIDDKAQLTTGSGGVYPWQCTPPAVSASEVRAALSAGEDVGALLPPPVAAHIAELFG